MQRFDNVVRVRVAAPKAGTFLLTLFAGPAVPLDVALTYRLEFAGKDDKESRFPTLTKDYFDKKANVFSPTVDTLEAGKVTYFAARVPGAKQVRSW